MYGVVASNAVKIYSYTLAGQLVKECRSVNAAIEWLNLSRSTVYSYMDSGKHLNGNYLIIRSPLL